jgi:hypothetical protein
VRRLNRLSLIDRRQDEVDWPRVACAIFACGTETRCVALFSQLPQLLDEQALVLEFDGQHMDDQLAASRQFFAKRVRSDQFFAPGADVLALIECILRIVARARNDANLIFVDISSMPRLWYLSIIVWFRYSSYASTHKLILGYSGGLYPEPYPERQIMELRSVAGTGGYYDASQPVIAIVNVGFDAGAALAIEDRIEPEKIIAVIVRTDKFEQELSLSETLNEEFLTRADIKVYLPHLSFSQPYRGICELLAPINDVNVVCVPLGPKTHVVALALAGLVFPRATSIHLISKYSRPFRADPSGQVCFGELTAILEQ